MFGECEKDLEKRNTAIRQITIELQGYFQKIDFLAKNRRPIFWYNEFLSYTVLDPAKMYYENYVLKSNTYKTFDSFFTMNWITYWQGTFFDIF